MVCIFFWFQLVIHNWFVPSNSIKYTLPGMMIEYVSLSNAKILSGCTVPVGLDDRVFACMSHMLPCCLEINTTGNTGPSGHSCFCSLFFLMNSIAAATLSYA